MRRMTDGHLTAADLEELQRQARAEAEAAQYPRSVKWVFLALFLFDAAVIWWVLA